MNNILVNTPLDIPVDVKLKETNITINHDGKFMSVNLKDVIPWSSEWDSFHESEDDSENPYLIYSDNRLGERSKKESEIEVYDEVFRYVYIFTFNFTFREKYIFVLNDIKYVRLEKTVSYFDNFIFPVFSDDKHRFVLHKINDEKFMLDLKHKMHFYVSDHDDDKLSTLIDKLNNVSKTGIEYEDNQGHGYDYYADSQEVFYTYYDGNDGDDLYEYKIFILS